MESNLHVCEVKAEKREFSQVTFLSFFGTGSPQMRSGKRASNEVYADMDSWKGLFSQKRLAPWVPTFFLDFQQFLKKLLAVLTPRSRRRRYSRERASESL
jgi:hypothetical protein